MLTNEVACKEILEAITNSPLKALDSNRMNAAFYDKCWNIVGKNICKMVWSFFTSAYIVK